jgi:F0F1-type ATP synthase epsilon subunit
MGILSHHVPTIVQLKPGIVEIITEAQQSGEKYFGRISSSLGFVLGIQN